ncbi:3,4-dihydroxy-2-butanone-4-phosphate synthase [Congregibacter litoralis]|uniref:3,4-dihydroxy-2-butanone 4-phosphate synthase n=1 Tax=Congregibacter litoralis KT71 TaxID=314285 RepID=A4A6E4_9GAMM|nr:3,4-dihydroxy-2-butanone 4-phosphate synthase [Congregibacter litoralis KT71]
MSKLSISSVGELLDDLRQGRMVVILDERNEKDARNNEGVVMVAAEHCSAEHVTFMARKARGLVCLALTQERCEQLDLPPMVAGAASDNSHFTLSIEAAKGIDTGISAADRAHTVQVAVAAQAEPADIVQPGHIFPLAAQAGGVLTRAGHTETAVDYTRIAGLTPAAVIADVLDDQGELADGPALTAFAEEHGLKVGTVADLIHYRIANEQTIERVREGVISTRYGNFQLATYRDRTHGGLHIALSLGEISATEPTLVRVHATSTLRDLLGSDVQGQVGWSVQRSLAAIAKSGSGVLVLLGRSETDEQLLHSVDLALGEIEPRDPKASDSYNTVGVGSQILRELGVGKIRLMGAPIKYNAISGFGLEVIDYLEPVVSEEII